VAGPDLIPAPVLARLRDAQLRLFTVTASVVNPAKSDASDGSWTSADGTAVEYPCNITPKGTGFGGEKRDLHEDRLTALATHILRLPHDAVIASGAKATVAGVVYDIAGVDERHTNMLYTVAYAVEGTAS
jgi:hypothetical protein